MTWEDGLPPPVPLPVPLPKMMENQPLSYHGLSAPSILDWTYRDGNACTKEWFCTSYPMPLSVNSTHRAAPAFVGHAAAVGGTSWLGLLTPKVATTTLGLFTTQHNITTRDSQHVRDACGNLSYRSIVQEAVDVAAYGPQRTQQGPRASPALAASTTACGLASTFDLEPNVPQFSVAFVRDPVDRFISALDAHGYVGQVRMRLVKETTGLDRIPMNASAVEVLAARARRMRSRQDFVDDQHVRSQSYSLAATNREGAPIRWGS